MKNLSGFNLLTLINLYKKTSRFLANNSPYDIFGKNWRCYTSIQESESSKVGLTSYTSDTTQYKKAVL